RSAVLVVLRELRIDVRDHRERDRLRRVDLPDRRPSYADLLLTRRTVAQLLSYARGVDALCGLEGFHQTVAREVAHLDGLLEDRVQPHRLHVSELEVVVGRLVRSELRHVLL